MNSQSRGRSPGMMDRLVTTALNNPEALLLLGAGAALLVRSGGAAGRRRRGRGSQSVRSGDWFGTEQISQAMADARQYAGDVGDRVADFASSYASSASRYADRTARAVSERSSELLEDASSTIQDTADRMLRDQPLVVVAAGLLAGAAVAAAFPRTDIERRTIGPAGERMSEFVGERAERLKEAGMRAGEQFMNSAEERGLSPEGLKEMAQEAAGAFGEAFSGDNRQGGESRGETSSQPGGPGGSAG